MNKKIGISSNILKIIAVLLMITDHIAEYFYPSISPYCYYLLRSLGRISMPIFSYLIVQGFFYTKNLKKYIFRMLNLAIITQVILFVLGFVNQEYCKEYKIGINRYLTVVFSYALSLIFIAMLDRKKAFIRFNSKINLFIRIIIIFVILFIYLKLKIEFGFQVLFLFLGIYLIEKIFSDDFNNLLLKRKFYNKKSYIKNKTIYLLLITLIIFVSMFLIDYNIGWKYTILFAIIPISIYNGNRGKNSNIVKYSFYYIFPLHHFILYMLAMIIYN